MTNDTHGIKMAQSTTTSTTQQNTTPQQGTGLTLTGEWWKCGNHRTHTCGNWKLGKGERKRERQ
jgi:hypothetical protein